MFTFPTAPIRLLRMTPGFGRSGAALISGGMASGKTVLLDHLAAAAAADGIPVSRAAERPATHPDDIEVPTQGLLLLDNPLAQGLPVGDLLDLARQRGAAVVATAFPEQHRQLDPAVLHRLTSSGHVWLHHPKRQPSAPVDVTALERHGHGYLDVDGNLTEFHYTLHPTHVCPSCAADGGYGTADQGREYQCATCLAIWEPGPDGPPVTARLSTWIQDLKGALTSY